MLLSLTVVLQLSNLIFHHFHSDMIDYEFCDASSVTSSQCSSCGTPSCSSSPCSSDRDYTIESPSLHESLFDIDEENMGILFMHSHSSLMVQHKSFVFSVAQE